ncbi:hypothetical protein Zmor_020504 [Zophobas morio]|uniref:HAUS augmin-like complex subunit 3 N-terminal domain-containing protein n=1 Tax=Zophobas morio TaxID=2755281 RepID=A0AA38M9P3_9CUCU|nr:hypothetical protein Zmor_020504 [Zophobas morio]
MDEDALLNLFEKINIKIGKLKPHVIKAWFDTDCDNLLQWMYTSITEECYVSAQQELEYAQCDVLTHDQLQKKMKIIETEYPDICQVDTNMFEIEFSKSTAEVLEEELKDYEHQICVNEEIYETLLAELSMLSTKEMQAQLEEESAQGNCVTLAQNFDKINSQTYDQILKYGSYLSSYEIAEIPRFANKVDMGFEQKFCNAVNQMNSIIHGQQDSFETSCVKYLADTLSELESCIFQSKVSLLALQMEVEALNSTLNFLDNYDINQPWLDYEPHVLSTGVNMDQQTSMMNLIENLARKLAQHCVKQPTFQCLKNQFEFFQLKLNYVNKSRDTLASILCHFIIMHSLYLQEKTDIHSSSQFFRNINKYVCDDIKGIIFRTEAMLKLISEYENFCSSPFENKIPLVGNFGVIVQKPNQTPLMDVLQEVTFLRNSAKKAQELQWSSVHLDKKVLRELRDNIQILENFLICGPTSQIVIVPVSVTTRLLTVNQILINQRSSVKLLIQTAQKPKDQRSKNKWIKYQNILWTYFMTDSTKLLSFLEQLKADEKKGLKVKDM